MPGNTSLNGSRKTTLGAASQQLLSSAYPGTEVSSSSVVFRRSHRMWFCGRGEQSLHRGTSRSFDLRPRAATCAGTGHGREVSINCHARAHWHSLVALTTVHSRHFIYYIIADTRASRKFTHGSTLRQVPSATHQQHGQSSLLASRFDSRCRARHFERIVKDCTR